MLCINGLWVEGAGAEFCSIDPAHGSVVWQGRAADTEQVEAAVAAARHAFPAWAALGVEARLAVLHKAKALFENKKEDLARLIARETGKLLWDSRGEAAAVVAKFAFAEAAYAERTGEKVVFNEKLQQTSMLRHRPHGVMAVYGPYNFPAHLPGGHIVPALLAGNTVVFKPSELTPAVAEFCVRVWEEAGLPAGVLNLVQGEVETGKALANNDIDGLLFTGSSATGRALHAQFAGRPEVILALELGGNNPLIVYEPEDVRGAVREVILSAYMSSGQRCTCARRLILPEWEGRQAFIDMLTRSVAALTVGKWDDAEESFMGPLVSMREARRVMDAQAALEASGGQVLVRARMPDSAVPMVSPALIEVTNVLHIPDEEIFGPLLKIYNVQSVDESFAIANATGYGLSAGVITQHLEVYHHALQKLRVGILNWNRQTTGASGSAPFGGIGASGNHRAAGYYAADYCAYPLASIEATKLALPEVLEPGLKI